MALSLSRGKDGVIRVEGEGKLYANDLKAMLRAEGIHSSDVRDIIVGDGITEIGYRTFHHLKYLETLKLGGSVARISPGALKYCTSLKWLFLPSGLRDIGAGFLLGCDDCRVVTDAVPEAVPALENVKEAERIIAGVDSVDALRAVVGTGMKLPDALSKWWP